MTRKTSGCAWVALALILATAGMVALGTVVSTFTEKKEAAEQQARIAAEQKRVAALTPEQREAEKEAKKVAAAAAAERAKVAAFSAAKNDIDEIEARLKTNAEMLGKYYGTTDQVKQATADLLKLAAAKGMYADSTDRDEKSIGAKADALIPRVSQQQRVLYASATEETFMKSGMGINVTAAGTKKDQLRLKYALMSQPLVYKFQNEAKLSDAARAFGFKKIVYTDGYNSTWNVDL